MYHLSLMTWHHCHIGKLTFFIKKKLLIPSLDPYQQRIVLQLQQLVYNQLQQRQNDIVLELL